MTKESKSETLVIMIEPSLKKILQDFAKSKNTSLAEYTRFVIQRGLDAIYERNLALRRIEQELIT